MQNFSHTQTKRTNNSFFRPSKTNYLWAQKCGNNLIFCEHGTCEGFSYLFGHCPGDRYILDKCRLGVGQQVILAITLQIN